MPKKTSPIFRPGAGRRRWAFSLLAAILCLPGFSDGGDGGEAVVWKPRITATSPVGNIYFTHAWEPAAGLELQLVATAGNQQASLLVSAAKFEIHLPTDLRIPLELKQPPRLNAKALPAAKGDVEFILKIRPQQWILYAGDRRLLTMAAPFAAPLTVMQPARDVPPAGQDDAFFQKIEPFVFSDDFLVPEEEENTLEAWEKVAGSWNLHTAVDNAVERQDITEGAAKRPEPSRSPNFYSLSGAGEPALILAGHEFYDDYSIESAVHTQAGEAGVVFHAGGTGAVYGFTLTLADGAPEALLRLWRSDAQDCRRRYVLAAAVADIATGQWLKLRATVAGGRIRCQIDDTEVFDKSLPLSSGGRFGLFANTVQPIRFDDVLAKSFRDLDLRSVNDLLGHCRLVSGAFAGEGRERRRFRKPRPTLSLAFPRDHPPGEMVIGSPEDDGHWFACDVQPLAGDFRVGIMAARRGAEEPYYRFVYRRREKTESVVFEKVAGDRVETLDRFEFAARVDREARISLACDGSEAGTLKFHRDGILLMSVRPAGDLRGASGVWVDENAKVAFNSFVYRFEPPPVFRNKFEKNRIFASDPFMRHWSSPEGEWIETPGGETWYKGDFLGRFALNMPFVRNSEIHLGVREEQSAGDLVVRTSGDTLTIAAAQTPDQPLVTVAAAELVESSGLDVEDAAKTKMYSIEVEGHCVDVRTGSKPLAKLRMAQPLPGRRVRIKGFSTGDLAHSYVDRYSVQDFLFNESLYNWVVNGGSWEVVNRFKCQPRWSHMNGESANGLAALWSKYDFGGDFCVEMYAGMRHGWYERAGDLNLTVLNHRSTPSQGYTITTTGWDPDHSQLWTILYRDGVELARSDKYLVPRIRDGNVRKGYTPLVSSGRPIHGAWYYLKLRRVGQRMEFYFDNELVFSALDPKPISGGGLGIWTYMNSMMVARVKCSAERIVPRRISVRPVALDYRLASPPPPQGPAYRDAQGLRYPLTDPEFWQVDDEVGRSRLDWHRDSADGSAYFTMTTRLGGGQFLAVCEAPPQPLAQVAGWTFEMKRTADAQVNFHYAVGSLGAGGQFIPAMHGFQVISGTPLALGGYLRGGKTDLPAGGKPGPDWHRRGGWTRVTVWIDAVGPEALRKGNDWYVKPIGFGNLQPSFVSQGLLGNGPGEAYGVKNLVPIRYGAPQFKPSEDGAATGFRLLGPDGKTLGAAPTVAELNPLLAAVADEGLNCLTLKVEGGTPGGTLPLWWINLPETPRLDFRWHDERPDVVVIKSAGGFADRRFLGGEASVNGIALKTEFQDVDCLTAALPRTAEIMADTPLAVGFAAGGTLLQRSLPWETAPVKSPPVLLAVEGGPPLALTFEDGRLAPPLNMDPRRMTLATDALGGNFLEVANPGSPTRLLTMFAQRFDASRFPVLQFDYRADRMANVTLVIDGRHPIKFGEEAFPARTVRFAEEPMRQDENWHSWLGFAADAFPGGGLGRNGFAASQVQIRSMDSQDQTGLRSKLCLDNLVVGPAVRAPEDLTVTPVFYDRWGVKSVEYAIYGGKTPYRVLSESAKKSLEWVAVPTAGKVQPMRLPPEDGAGHFLIRAVNPLGLYSEVFDMPFLTDTAPPVPRHEFRLSDDPADNGTRLRVTVDLKGGAPLDLSSLSFAWDGQAVTPDPAFSSHAHSANADLFDINWPHLFRSFLDQAGDGQTSRITISGIQDGAGNKHPDWVVPVTIRHADDKTGPTLLPADFSEAVLSTTGWESPVATAVGFEVSNEGSLQLVRKAAQTSFLQARSATTEMNVWKSFASGRWNLKQHPLVAFRVRRPRFKENDKVKVELLVSLNRSELYVFPLDDKQEGSLGMNLGRQFSWSGESWTGGVVNLYDLMLEALERKEKRDAEKSAAADRANPGSHRAAAVQTLDRQSVLQVGFRITGTTARDLFEIRDLYVLRPWNDADTLIFDAYDASGVAGITAAAGAVERGIDALRLKPAKTPPAEWLIVRIRDKAGNFSPEIWVPGRQ